MPALILGVQGLETQFNTPEGIVHAFIGIALIPKRKPRIWKK
jgi:hypothetical protein